MFFKNSLFLILIPFAAALIFSAQKKVVASSFRFSTEGLLKGLRSSLKLKFARNLFFLRIASITLLIAALSRPQSPIAESKVETEGIDIALALDCSTSMLAEDFKMSGRRHNRLEVVKEVVKDFVKGRANDRIAIVAFAARAYTVCPLTLDYSWLLENLSRIKTGLIEDGTAIGSGIAASLNRFKNTKAKSKVIILLTDGRNNTGKISPEAATQVASVLKARIYTIGAGTKGLAPYPTKDFFGNTVYQAIQIDIDEALLKEIAAKTGGKYFRATDTESLREIYKEINTLEKTVIEEKGYGEYKELFPYFLVPGLILLFLEVILCNTVFRKIP